MTLSVHSPHTLRYCKALVFAPPGHGKTVFLGTAQEDERTYPMALVDWEAGTESLTGLDIDVFPIRSWEDANELIELFQDGTEAEINGEVIDFGEYKSIGVDSISEWDKWAKLERLRVKGKGRNDPDLLEWQDYNVTAVQLRRVLRKFRDLPMHVFFSAHAKVDQDRRLTLPDLSGQLAEEVAGLVSVIGYLARSEDADDEERLLLLHGWPRYRTKARTPWRKQVPTELESPTVTALLNTLGYSANHK